jgi:hypothetical protein
MIRKWNILVLLFSVGIFAQSPVTTNIDTTRNKIGAQFNLTIKAIADTAAVVVFPKAETFGQLEVIRDFDVDTVRKNKQYELVKKYGLSQYEFGKYTIPELKVLIGKKEFKTKEFKVEVDSVAVDTLKQKLFDIKEIVAAGDTKKLEWWGYVAIAAGVLLLAFIVVAIIKRKRPAKKIAEVHIPPLEKANNLLKQLEGKHLLEQGEIKHYYSELTDIARNYIEEAIHIPAMESTTSELIIALRIAASKKNMTLSPEIVGNLEEVLRQADLVKFAKSKPLDFEIAQDRQKIETAIVKIDSAIPEEVDEEDTSELDEKARLEKLKKQKRKKILNIVAFVVAFVIAFLVGMVVTKGFDFYRDFMKGDPTKDLLEGEWVKSEYGDPSVVVETPQVLTRVTGETPDKTIFTDEQKFTYGKYTDAFSIMLTTSRIADSTKTKKLLDETVEATASHFEKQFNAKNISLKSDQYDLPAGQKGKKTFGSMKLTNPDTKESHFMNYDLLTFTEGTGVVQLLVIYKADDQNAIKMVDKIFESVEIKTAKP